MRIDSWTSVRALLPGAWASLALLQSCAQVVGEAPDAGQIDAPQIAAVDPQPGAVSSVSRFQVTFSRPMDLSTLLAAPGRSDTVVLVPAESVDIVATALSDGKLNAGQRSLLLAAAASVPPDSTSIALAPSDELPAGDFYLLVSNRLKDVSGQRMSGNPARYAFSVEAPPAQPHLDTPEPGSEVPMNLARVRVSFPDGPPSGPVSIVERGGGTVSTLATSDGGPVLLDLIDSGRSGCAPLCAGSTYAVAETGNEVDGTSFIASSCAHVDPPRWLSDSPSVSAGDRWLDVSLALDWPALVHLEARAGGSAGSVPIVDVLVHCAPAVCGADAGTSADCTAQVRLDGLEAASTYVLRAWAEDDEGNRSDFIERPFVTTGALPGAQISEVMASPPLPVPRSDGEYIEILNSGAGPIDCSRLALSGSDDRVRPIIGGSAPAQVLVAPGARALAVGSAFDESRYQIPSNVPILRADTQRLLGHGVADQPPAIRLLWLDADGGPPVEIDRYPGDGPTCDLGESLERTSSADGGTSWRCGVDGGSPGRPP
jgi:hypothetical protein